MNPVNPNGPLHGASPVNGSNQNTNNQQQSPAQQQGESSSKKKEGKKRFKILRRIGKFATDSAAPLLIASSLAIRPIAFQCTNLFTSDGITSGVAAFLATKYIKRNVYKIKERKKGSELDTKEKWKINGAMLASAAVLGIISILITNHPMTLTWDAIIAMVVAVGSGVVNLGHKLATHISEKKENEGPVK